MRKILNLIKKNRYTVMFVLMIVVMAIVDRSLVENTLKISWNNVVTMMGVIPPIFVLIGLMDVWVPKETMIKYMGEHSGAVGLLIAFLLGSMAAGPLYVAFPVAGLLLRKGARIAYVIFFLGTWTSAKIPLLLFEMTSLGVKFTVIHVVSMITMYLVGAFFLESLLKPHEKTMLLQRVESL